LDHGDGGFDGHGRGAGRVTLFTNNFTLEEVELLLRAFYDVNHKKLPAGLILKPWVWEFNLVYN
jgi:hypothetical protein